MKHIITTTPYIEFAIPYLINKSTDLADVFLLCKQTDSVSVSILKAFAEADDFKLRVIISETKEENLLWLGSILCGKKDDDEFIVLGDSIVLSDNIKKTYGIRTEKVKKEKSTKPKVRNLRKNNSPDETAGCQKKCDEENQFNIQESKNIQEKEPAKKQIVKGPVVQTAAEPDEHAGRVLDNIDAFIKAMSVRATDLYEFKGDDKDLALKLAGIIITARVNTGTADKVTLEKAVRAVFCEDDAETIWHWIKPNLKKLTDLAAEIVF